MIHSYSSMATYKQCPAKWNWTYRDRFPVKRESSPQMERGTNIHKSVDAYMLRNNEYLHSEIHTTYGQFMFTLRENYSDIRPEFKWGITRDFQEAPYSGPDTMLHGYFDLLIVPEGDELLLYEWKTGKRYEEHNQQMCTYATAALAMFPDKKVCKTSVVYFDQQDYKPIDYPQSMMFEYKPALLHEIEKIENTVEFIPMPSWKCGSCPFSRHNGGPCAF